MKHQNVNKISLSNEKGATIVEASVVLPLFILFVLGIILICTQLFASYKTYFANYQTLKAISTGPLRDQAGVILPNGNVEDRFRRALSENLKKYNTGVVIGTDKILIRNSAGCYKVVGSANNVFIQKHVLNADQCVSHQKPFQIKANDWITLETYIKPVGLKFNRIPIPTMKIISTVRMYDF